jgi:hypothetical protein
MSYADDTIDWQSIRDIDAWLDRAVSGMYTDQPLAQDWARLSKVAEELSEALEELPEDATAQDLRRINEITKALGKAIQDHIGATGQNPRKGTDLQGYNKMLGEGADIVLTGILMIQHFTKDIEETRNIIRARLTRTYMRMLDANRREDDSI